jgi:hypothetical protein
MSGENHPEEAVQAAVEVKACEDRYGIGRLRKGASGSEQRIVNREWKGKAQVAILDVEGHRRQACDGAIRAIYGQLGKSKTYTATKRPVFASRAQ